MSTELILTHLGASTNGDDSIHVSILIRSMPSPLQ
jgi:hypothetical protein